MMTSLDDREEMKQRSYDTDADTIDFLIATLAARNLP